MANDDVCAINLNGLDAGEADQVKKDIKRIVDAAKLDNKMGDIQESIMVALDDYEKMLDVAAKIEKRNAYLNRVAQKQMYDYVMTNWADNPLEGLYAYLAGSQREVTGARRSVSVSIEVQQNVYKNVLRAKLSKENLLNEAKSGLYDAEVFKAMDAIHRGEDLSSYSNQAVSLAKIYDNMNQMMRRDMNKAGAVVGDLDGFVISRHHEMFKINKDRSGWVDWMMNSVDWDRSFPGLSLIEKTKMLEKQANEFASGAHITFQGADDPGKGLKGFSSIAKRVSKNRVYHFKSADMEYEYAQKWGEPNLLRSFISSAEQRGRTVGMMRTLGPNAEMNIDKTVNNILDNLSKQGIRGQESAKMTAVKEGYEKIKNNLIPHLTGRASIPGNHVFSTIESSVLALQRTSALGGSAIASAIGDSTVRAINVMRLDPEFSAAFKGYGQYFSDMFRNIGDPDVQEFLADVGVQNDYLLANISHRFGEDMASITRAQRTIQNLENQFFFWNGQYFVDSRARAGAAIGLASRMGYNSGKAFGDLRDSYKRLLDKHSIDAADWDMARASTGELEGRKILNIEGVKNLPDETIAAYMSAKGIKDTKFNRERTLQELVDKTRGMFQDEQGYNVLAADTRLRAMMFGGQQAGSRIGFARKAFWQFKQFPTAMIQRMWGREVYAKSPMHSKIIAMTGILAMSTFAGYVNIAVTDMRKGRNPRVFGVGAKEDAQLIADSFFRGGGAGVYGDFIYNFTQDSYGNSPAGKFLGPTFADLELLFKGINDIAVGDVEKGGDKLVNLGISNIPFSNIPPVKAALDYAILNQLQESLNPGMLSRSETKMRERTGQEYFMMRPQDTMLFK